MAHFRIFPGKSQILAEEILKTRDKPQKTPSFRNNNPIYRKIVNNFDDKLWINFSFGLKYIYLGILCGFIVFNNLDFLY
jgi:hypothetical protein